MYYAQILGDVADKTSTLERRAEEVEREHRSMYSYVRLSIDRCTATYV